MRYTARQARSAGHKRLHTVLFSGLELTELSYIRIYEVRIGEMHTLHEDLHTVLIILVTEFAIVPVVAGVTHTPRQNDGERTRSVRCPYILWLLCLVQY